MNQMPNADLVPEHCRSLFLGDLSTFCQENDVFAIFQQCGDIEEVRIKRSKEGTGLGYGFVTYFDMKAAQAAMLLDGTVILGRPVK
jgi:RNA recognition motif-containing protein